MKAVAVAMISSSFNPISSGGFRRLLQDEGLGHELLQKFQRNDPSFGDFPAMVVPDAVSRHLPQEAVDQHIPGSRIETDHVLGTGSFGDVGQIADPSDIVDGPVELRVTKEQIVQVRSQRRAEAPRRDVARPEIGDDGHAGPLGDDRRFADLKGAFLSQMTNRLAMRADQVEF